MNPRISEALADARQQWAGNRRLRIGVLAIAAIVGLYLVLVLRDWRQSLAHDYAERTVHLYKMKALAGQDEWLQRAQDARQVREALEAEIPAVATIGLAQARVQGWVRQATASMGDSVRVQAGEPAEVEGRPGLWRVPMTVSGPFDPQRYLGLVGRVEGNPTLSTIEEAMVLNRENQTFSLTIVSYFRVVEGADAPA